MIGASDSAGLVVADVSVDVIDMPEIIGTPGKDKLIGTGAGEIIDGLANKDRLKGNGGDDIFVVSADAKDKILDFTDGADLIDLCDWGTQGFDELSLKLKPAKGKIKIFDKITKAQAELKNIDPGFDIGDLDEDDFLFAPREDLLLTGTDGADTLRGRSGDDTLDGGLRKDCYIGNGGADTFVLGVDKKDVVKDFALGEDILDVSAWGVAQLADLTLKFKNGKLKVYDPVSGAKADILGLDPGFVVGDLSDSDFSFA